LVFWLKGYGQKNIKLVILQKLAVLPFLTRNAKKSIKGSKDSDFNLVSKKNLSEILPSSVWDQVT